jgi:hypothetical protein
MTTTLPVMGIPSAFWTRLCLAVKRSVGRLEYRYDDDAWTWSDTVARMHGYEPGEIELTPNSS